MRKFFIAAVLIGAAVLGAPNQGRAAFQIALQEAGVNGGAITVVASGADFTSASFTGTYGDFKITVFGGGSDNGALLSDLLSSTTAVENLSGTTQTLKLWVTQDNYTLPSATVLNVESGLGGSVNVGTIALTGIFQAYADKNNNLFGTSDFTNGPQSASQNGSTFDTGSANGKFTRLGTAYSLTSVATFTLSGGGKDNFSSHVNVTPTPAPAGLILALTGAPVLGIGAWIRRRRTLAAV